MKKGKKKGLGRALSFVLGKCCRRLGNDWRVAVYGCSTLAWYMPQNSKKVAFFTGLLYTININ